MNEEMRVEAMELCVTACEKHSSSNEVYSIIILPGLELITIVIIIDCNRLHFLCNHNYNRNHTFSKLDVIIVMLCYHL